MHATSGRYGGARITLHMPRAPIALVLCLALPALTRAQQVPAITSDTLDYCVHLATEIAQAPSPPDQAKELLAQGEQMCRNGEIRGGISRLRRAMMMLRAQASP